MVGDEAERAHQDMQVGLVRSFFWLLATACSALVIRELVAGGPVLTAVLGLVWAVGALLWSYRGGAPLRLLGLLLFFGMVLLIAKAALELGGASGSALSFSFLPAFLAMLALGPRWGWLLCVTMLSILAWLAKTTPIPSHYDGLRLVDIAAMTLFASGLGHALTRSLVAYEQAIAKRKEALLSLSQQRQQMVEAIYDKLEPLSAQLAAALEQAPNPADSAQVEQTLEPMLDGLSSARALSIRAPAETTVVGDPDLVIRRNAMRVWLRLGAVLMVFFVLRNLFAGVSYVPSIFAFGFCIALDIWLGKVSSVRHTEWTAFLIGLLATGPMMAHIYEYGATPDVPPLVITPSIVLFTALLSHGRATWAMVVVQIGILAWVATGTTLTLVQLRLLSDLVLCFVVVVVALRSFFKLRYRYAELLLEQGRNLTAALRQNRRLSGTLFHDVSNHLQALIYHLEYDDAQRRTAQVRSLGRRIHRLVVVSKGILVDAQAGTKPSLVPVLLTSAVKSLEEAYGPRLENKQLHFVSGPGLELSVLALPEVLVESVLGNLLSNAIKFSPPGETIRLRAERSESLVCITMSDSGPGIPDEVLQLLEEEGAVPSQQGTAGEQGQGFGLQLVQEHLQRMGGRMELSSRPEGGTSAKVWLVSAE